MIHRSQFHSSLVTVIALAITLVAGSAAAQDAMFIDSSGRVGIGTNNPGGNLHIFGGATEDVFNAIGPSATTNAFNFGYSGASFGSGSGFFNVRPVAGAVAPNPSLNFATANVVRMILDNEGFLGVHTSGVFNPVHPIQAQVSGAHLSAAGVWTNASSRELKENIQPLDFDRALATLRELEPVEFNYKVQRDDPQIGFIAEDVPDLVATPDRKSLAPTDIVGVLTRVVQEQQRQIEELTAKLEQLHRQ